MRGRLPIYICAVFMLIIFSGCAFGLYNVDNEDSRQRILFNDDWKFMKYENPDDADNLIYDVRPEIENANDTREADSEPQEAIETEAADYVLKDYILPTANPFIKDSSQHFIRPEGNPGADFKYVQIGFDDSTWEDVRLPHDWAIKGPFMEGQNAEVGGGMGRLPSPGIAWYRKEFNVDESDKDRSIFLEVGGAMSYAMVWLNGKLAGGWPYGYNSWRLDLTPYIDFSGSNQIAIRVDNPNHSARWYPGGGIYRDVWLIKTHKIHIAHWGTFITTPQVSKSQAEIELSVSIENQSDSDHEIGIKTEIYSLNELTNELEQKVKSVTQDVVRLKAKNEQSVKFSTRIENPELWGPAPNQKPNLYKAITTLNLDGEVIDQYETVFGIRKVEFDPNRGVIVNGEQIELKGVNLHHDLGALGAAFHKRAAERQLEILKEMGCNAIRTAHNPPAAEFLDLTDRMGFLVVDEVFDCWERKKTPHDFHLIFKDWYEADIRSFIRRDRNHPSVIMWSYGNEVGEQYTDETGAQLSKKLADIVKDEDPTRLGTASMNYAKPGMPFPESMEIISLNYQGEGIRNAPAYSHLQGIKTSPLYPEFHEAFPQKVIISSETAAALSSRGTYLFPVTNGISSPISKGIGGDREKGFVSAYELYTANFGSSADKVFASQDNHPFVAGEFVWSGWDYLGEPTPFYSSRSSYYGIIDLAGFKKDRYYLYQSRWKPDLPMVHILPHWNWPDRIGEVTPVHVFTSGDEAELFLNGESLGRKTKNKFEYRIRWDDVKYEAGELKVITYKDGEHWAEKIVKTTTSPIAIEVKADRKSIVADGYDLSFITIRLIDKEGNLVPLANNAIEFMVEGPGELVGTDNGDPTDMVSFTSTKRRAFNGLALGLIRSKEGLEGSITVTVVSEGLEKGKVSISSKL